MYLENTYLLYKLQDIKRYLVITFLKFLKNAFFLLDLRENKIFTPSYSTFVCNGVYYES